MLKSQITDIIQDSLHQMIFCLLLILSLAQSQGEEELDKEVENLDATEDGETSEESHGASNKPKSTNNSHLFF